MAILSGGIRRARGAGSGVADAYQLVTMAQLRALIALADAGSYISASAATGLSQPSLHRAVRELEAASGLTLFVRSEEHTSELQSLMRISYAVFCLKKHKIP